MNKLRYIKFDLIQLIKVSCVFLFRFQSEFFLVHFCFFMFFFSLQIFFPHILFIIDLFFSCLWISSLIFRASMSTSTPFYFFGTSYIYTPLFVFVFISERILQWQISTTTTSQLYLRFFFFVTQISMMWNWKIFERKIGWYLKSEALTWGNTARCASWLQQIIHVAKSSWLACFIYTF